MTERDVVIIRGLVLQGFDNQAILDFMNDGQTNVPVKTTMTINPNEKVRFTSTNKQAWKNELGEVCRKIEQAKSRTEISEIHNVYNGKFGTSSVYMRVLKEACGKYPRT